MEGDLIQYTGQKTVLRTTPEIYIEDFFNNLRLGWRREGMFPSVAIWSHGSHLTARPLQTDM